MNSSGYNVKILILLLLVNYISLPVLAIRTYDNGTLTVRHDNSLYVMAFLTHLDDIITLLDVS